MRFYIPEIGDELVLEKDWEFTLVSEYRNKAAWEHWNGGKMPERHWSNNAPPYTKKQILRAGTLLKVDRIYVRKGSSDFSSITFYATDPGAKKKQRFWVKLEDANQIEFKRNETYLADGTPIGDPVTNIPNIEDELILKQDWTFTIGLARNADAWNLLVAPVQGNKWSHWNSKETKQVVLPTGTQLRVVWFSFSKGRPMDSTITLSVQRPGDKKKTKMHLSLVELNGADVDIKRAIKVEIEWERIPYVGQERVTQSTDQFVPTIHLNPPKDYGRVSCKIDGKEKYICTGIAGIAKFRNSYEQYSRTGNGKEWQGIYDHVPQFQLYI